VTSRQASPDRQAGSGAPLRRLLHEILQQDSLYGLQALLSTVARTAGATGALLWKETGNRPAAAASIVALWTTDGTATPAQYAADWLTVEALLSRTPAIPMRDGRNPTNEFGLPIMAALPVDYPDGLRGALTLLGDAELSPDGLGAALDLLDVLPHVWEILRERQCLGLVRACNDILTEADVEASGESLTRDRLGDYLAEVCSAVAGAMHCREVSIYLRDPTAAEGTYDLAARSPHGAPAGPPVRVGVGVIGQAISDGCPVVAALPEEQPRGNSVPSSAGRALVVPLNSGQHVWGAIACGGPPLRFTDSDLALVTPIAPHIAQYWSNWLHRRTISAENASWRALASGITDLNRLLFKELRRRTPNDGRVYRAAMRMVQKVLPESAGCDVCRSEPTPSGDRLLTFVCGTDAAARRPAAGHRAAPPIAAQVLHVRDQRWTADPAEVRAEGIGEPARWLVCSPIRVDEEPYGVLDVYGHSSAPPPNSRQICEIVGDQLGLYQRLKQAREELGDTIRAQAHAMEDLQHQLVSPLLVAVNRTDKMLDGKGLTGRVDIDVRAARAVRGLCRQASRVAMSAHIFAGLSTGRAPSPRPERLSMDEVIRVLIAGADDAQLLSDSRRRIRFDVDRETVRALAPRRIEADLSFLEQCLGNLLDNAAKYSYEGTRVEIRGEVDDREFAVAVTSTGLAMTAEDAELCMQRAWRGALASGVTGEGSGLGLWIVDNLMRSVGGTVRIQPLGDQTTVLLAFPLIPS
jgi:signal transduction histidine kinase